MHNSIIIEELHRVEGHGGISIAISDGKVTQVVVNIDEGTRFFEPLLVGRSYDEIPALVSRICAICSAVHTVTSLMAIEDAFGIDITRQTSLLRDLLIQGGNIASHALHLFCLAAPDYLGHTGVISLVADRPELVKVGLDLKRLGNTVQEAVGGRAVHPVNALVGGFSKPPTEEQLSDLEGQLRTGLQQALATVDIVSTLPIPRFPELETVYAALESGDNQYSFFGDKIIMSTGESIDARSYKEICNEKAVPHSRAKHSQFKNKPFMVGALSRIVLNGNKLSGHAKEAMERLNLNLPSHTALHNNFAQAVELVYSVERSLDIIEELLQHGVTDEKPAEINIMASKGTCACEAPRGMLFHSYTFDKTGRLAKADVVTPTAQNLACMEKDLRVLAEGLIGEPTESISDKLEMLARAYDPCISCAVHLVEVRHI